MASSLSRCFTSAAASTAVGSPPLVLIQVPDSLGDGEGGPISVDFLALEALVLISKSSSVLGVKCSVAGSLFRPSDMVVDLFADKLGWDVSPPLLSWQAGAVKDADWLLDEISKALASSDPISVPLVVDCFTGLVEALDPFPSGSPSFFPALRALRRLKRANFLEGGRPGPIVVATAMSSHSPLDHRLIEDEADVIVTITPLVTSKSQNKSSVYETLVVRKSASSGKVVTEKAGAAIEFKGGRWRMEVRGTRASNHSSSDFSSLPPPTSSHVQAHASTIPHHSSLTWRSR